MAGLRLIAGLGNPGPGFDGTPHNVGADFVRWLAGHVGARLVAHSRFKGAMAEVTIADRPLRLFVPSTYMNLSGRAVAPVVNYYRLALDQVLVAHDEMAFEPGVVRLKTGGGAAGHNGVRNIVTELGNRNGFHRLRIGVGHPGQAEAVSGYLTGVRMPSGVRETVIRAYRFDDEVLAMIVNGDMQKAMNHLHAPGDQ